MIRNVLQREGKVTVSFCSATIYGWKRKRKWNSITLCSAAGLTRAHYCPFILSIVMGHSMKYLLCSSHINIYSLERHNTALSNFPGIVGAMRGSLSLGYWLRSLRVTGRKQETRGLLFSVVDHILILFIYPFAYVCACDMHICVYACLHVLWRCIYVYLCIRTHLLG